MGWGHGWRQRLGTHGDTRGHTSSHSTRTVKVEGSSSTSCGGTGNRAQWVHIITHAFVLPHPTPRRAKGTSLTSAKGCNRERWRMYARGDAVPRASPVHMTPISQTPRGTGAFTTHLRSQCSLGKRCRWTLAPSGTRCCSNLTQHHWNDPCRQLKRGVEHAARARCELKHYAPPVIPHTSKPEERNRPCVRGGEGTPSTGAVPHDPDLR
jgi:hypothetical protein